MLYCVTNKALQCRELECRPTFAFALRKFSFFPEGKSTPKTHWIRSNGLTPPPVFIAFLAFLKMSSSCPTCRPGPTGPNSSYATVKQILINISSGSLGGGAPGAGLLTAADLWFFYETLIFLNFFLRSRLILSIILIEIWPKHAKKWLTSTFSMIFCPPPPPGGQILDLPLYMYDTNT